MERLAARSIEDRIGTPVSVSIATSIEPGIVRGELGNVTVKATQFERDGLRLAGARAVYRGVDVEVSDLISGDVRLHYSSVGFTGQLDPGGPRRLPAAAPGRARPAARRSCASRSATGRATLHSGSLHAAVRAKIVGVSSIRLVPVSGSQPLLRALAAPIQLGPLPDGIRLTAHRAAQGHARRSRDAATAGKAQGLIEGQASSTARVSRCWPTLRLTRCSALSTAFGSHSTISPISS